ncbi:MAG TPA: FAD-dependent oxidoreductase, partial [Clostridiales bacterium]|nr:FAD-dependent oxidoreductase [Clostridiales bacterium]
MDKRSVIIVGGDAAGMSAAAKAKRVNPNLEITVFEKGEYISYSQCGLPYYIS